MGDGNVCGRGVLADPPLTGQQSSQVLGTYAFLISLLSLFYVSNASLLLSHYDLGWHLAAGELIRNEARVPFQDPWSFTLGTNNGSICRGYGMSLPA